MEYEFRAHSRQLPRDEIWSELHWILGAIERSGIKSVVVLFGFAWGNSWRQWVPVTLNIDEVVSEIRGAETAEAGELGTHDLFLEVPEIEGTFVFCHESDLHVEFSHVTPLIHDTLMRWNGRGVLHGLWIRDQYHVDAMDRLGLAGR